MWHEKLRFISLALFTAVEENSDGERLVLGRSGNLPMDRQVCEGRFDLRLAHVPGVTCAVEEDETLDPGNVCFFRSSSLDDELRQRHVPYREGSAAAMRMTCFHTSILLLPQPGRGSNTMIPCHLEVNNTNDAKHAAALQHVTSDA